MMKDFIIDHDSVRLNLKELDPLGVKQRARRARHSVIRYTYISTDPNQTLHIDGYEKLIPFGFAIHGAIDGYSRKIL